MMNPNLRKARVHVGKRPNHEGKELQEDRTQEVDPWVQRQNEDHTPGVNHHDLIPGADHVLVIVPRDLGQEVVLDQVVLDLEDLVTQGPGVAPAELCLLDQLFLKRLEGRKRNGLLQKETLVLGGELIQLELAIHQSLKMFHV
jgi:hypothetical protein